MAEEKLQFTPSNGTEGDCFESKHCWNCAKFVHVKYMDDYDCQLGLLTKAYFFGDTKNWYEVWEDGDLTGTGCYQFKDKSIRSERAKKAHITMKENYHNDPRQLKLDL